MNSGYLVLLSTFSRALIKIRTGLDWKYTRSSYWSRLHTYAEIPCCSHIPYWMSGSDHLPSFL